MNMRECLFLYLLLLFLSCVPQKREERLSIEKSNTEAPALMLMDLGIKTFPIDSEADFSHLVGLQLTKLEDSREYMSFFNFGKRIIYQYDYETEEIVNKLILAPNGPDRIPFILSFEYFIHSTDSIFINSQSSGYYLIDENAKILNKIGGTSKRLDFAGNKISFNASSQFFNGRIHGAYKTTLVNRIEDLAYTHATLDFDNILELSPLHSRKIIYAFDKAMDIRRQEKKDGKNLLTMRQQFARNGKFLFATTPISDSIKVFKGNNLVETLYGTVKGFDLPSYREYINLVQIKNVPGEVSRITEPVQPAQYVNTFVDPSGKYLYRVFVHGTKSYTHPVSGVELPSPIGATLLAIDLDTRKAFQMELPIDEIEITVRTNKQVFVSSKGMHFKVKGQDNEDQVQFRVFGFTSEVSE